MVSVVSSSITIYLQSSRLKSTLKRGFNAFIQRFKRKSPKSSIIKLDARLDAIEQQIENVASRVKNRENNLKYQIRNEVVEYLKQLQK